MTNNSHARPDKNKTFPNPHTFSLPVFFIFVLFFVFVEGVVMFLFIPSTLELRFRDRSFVTQGQSVCQSQHEVKKHKHKTKIKKGLL